MTRPPAGQLDDALRQGSSVALDVEAQDDCSHYLALELEDVTVAASPEWAQKQLQAIGLQPINNVVDATNLVLHEFSSPLHAFDKTTLVAAKSECARQGKRSPHSTASGNA